MTARDKSSILDAIGGLFLGMVLGLLALFCFCGCSRQTLPPVQTVRLQDSVAYERIHTETLVPVTFIPPAQMTERTSRDSTSHLENDFAVSDARILPDGSLFHSLATKQNPITVEAPAIADTIREKEYVEVPVETPVPYPVERKLTRWEQLKMDFGGMAIGAVIVAIAIAVIWMARRFRRR